MIIPKIKTVYSDSEQGKKAAEIISCEIEKRTGIKPVFGENADIAFNLSDSFGRDEYEISLNDNKFIFMASGIRGFIYAIGMFLRKTEYRGNEIFLAEEICGKYTPYMSIRGHQLGYRTLSNTYDAWTPDDYYSYVKDLMYFGCNVFEHTVFDDTPENRNSLMKQSELDLINKCAEKVNELGVDISFWYPNDEKELSESVNDRVKFFECVPHADFYFPPGGDPGEFEAAEFIDRTVAVSRAIKRVNPGIKVYPSAQAPHNAEAWGDEFIKKMKDLPKEIDGVVTGPNCAMPLHDLRKRLPLDYPIRLYPDITHNVRCEYPVHFDRDDWHYSLAATLSREAINPRPAEYRTVHRMTRQYIIGSVSYSEGINDDVNKMVWSDMDFFPDADLTDTLSDYARLFFYGADIQKAVSGILGLEKNWEGDPAENPHIENTLKFFEDMLDERPELSENVRFLMLLFRAKCDMLVKMRRKKELKTIKAAKRELSNLNLERAEKLLKTPLGEEYDKIRRDISAIGEALFSKAGIQLDTEHYSANSWERGATLDTIDNPVTDKAWLINRIEYAKTLDESERGIFIHKLLNRNRTDKNEYYYSFAENSFTELGVPQDAGFYMDFQGDRPHINNGTIPMSMLKVFDHYSFKMKTGGLTNKKGYNLILNIKPRYNEKVTEFKIAINGKTLYKGCQYGGERDTEWENTLSAPGFECRVYHIPDDFIINGCIELEITEPVVGIMISEIFIKAIPHNYCRADVPRDFSSD